MKFYKSIRKQDIKKRGYADVIIKQDRDLPRKSELVIIDGHVFAVKDVVYDKAGSYRLPKVSLSVEKFDEAV